MACRENIVILVLYISLLPSNQGKLTCAPNWELHDETNCCYKFVEESKASYFGARQACVMEGAHVVSIHSQAENDFVLNGMEKITKIPFWIGGRINQNRTLEWDDHSPTDYHNWTPGEPNDWGPAVEDSVMMEASGADKKGKWNDVHVAVYHDVPSGYVCKKCSDSRFCPTNWIEYGQACYLVLGSVASKISEAEKACSSKGGALLSVTSEYEQKYITKIGEAMFANDADTTELFYVWTSGKEVTKGTDDPITWKWGDGSDVIYQNWIPMNIANIRLKSRCIILERFTDFKWFPVSCFLNVPHAKTICKKSKDYSNYRLMQHELINYLHSKSKKFNLAPYSPGGSPVEVNMEGFLFTDLGAVDEAKPSITLQGEFFVNWNHPFLTWNVTHGKFKGIEEIYIDHWRMWTPNVNFRFASDQNLRHSPHQVFIRHDGLCLQTLPLNGEIQCGYSSFNFPFDSMRCTLGVGPPPGLDDVFKIVVPKVMGIQTKLRPVIEGYTHQGWIVSRINATIHDPRKSTKPTMDLDLQSGNLMIDVSLVRNYSYYTLSLVIPLASSMLLLLLSFWVSDMEVASLLVMASLLVSVLFLQDTISGMPHSVDAVPSFLVLYGITLVFIGLAFVILVILEKTKRMFSKEMQQSETVSGILSPLYSISQKFPGSELDMAIRYRKSASETELTKSPRADVVILIVKKILFATLLLFDIVLLIWVLKLIYSGYYWAGPLPDKPVYHFQSKPSM